MNTNQLTLDVGKKTRASEAVDTDITNTARFGTKGLGSMVSHMNKAEC